MYSKNQARRSSTSSENSRLLLYRLILSLHIPKASISFNYSVAVLVSLNLFICQLFFFRLLYLNGDPTGFLANGRCDWKGAQVRFIEKFCC